MRDRGRGWEECPSLGILPSQHMESVCVMAGKLGVAYVFLSPQTKATCISKGWEAVSSVPRKEGCSRRGHPNKGLAYGSSTFTNFLMLFHPCRVSPTRSGSTDFYALLVWGCWDFRSFASVCAYNFHVLSSSGFAVKVVSHSQSELRRVSPSVRLLWTWCLWGDFKSDLTSVMSSTSLQHRLWL